MTDVVRFSIGIADEINYSQLELAAGTPNNVRIYSSFEQFADAVAEIMYDVCWIPLNIDVSSLNETDLALRALQRGQPRYLKVEYKQGSMVVFEFEVTQNSDVLVYYSYTNPYPSASSNDGTFVIRESTTFASNGKGPGAVDNGSFSHFVQANFP